MQWRVAHGMMWMNKEVTLSKLWKTSELRHMMMAMALFPKARQNTAVKRRFEPGKIQMLRRRRKLTK